MENSYLVQSTFKTSLTNLRTNPNNIQIVKEHFDRSRTLSGSISYTEWPKQVYGVDSLTELKSDLCKRGAGKDDLPAIWSQPGSPEAVNKGRNPEHTGSRTSRLIIIFIIRTCHLGCSYDEQTRGGLVLLRACENQDTRKKKKLFARPTTWKTVGQMW